MKTSTLRLRRVRLKNGATVEVLRTLDPAYSVADVCDILTDTIGLHQGAGYEVSGFAFVCWSKQGTCTAIQRAGNVPPAYVPDLARASLLGDKIMSWIENK